jgi:hypothetical protein
MAYHLMGTGIFASLATASVVVPDQQALIQSNKHLHQDLLPATGVYDQVWLMELVARAISSVIMMWLLLTLAKRFGSMQDEDTDLNQKTRPQDELRPFWWAVEMGDVELLSSILDADPALACRVDEEGRTALHVAAFTGASDSLKFLLQREVDVNMPDANGETALHLAAGAGHLCCLIILLDASANQDLKNTAGCTALGKARTADEKAACELLVDHGGVQLAFES